MAGFDGNLNQRFFNKFSNCSFLFQAKPKRLFPPSKKINVDPNYGGDACHVTWPNNADCGSIHWDVEAILS